MIIDCFPFFRELDLLEIRLNTLAPVVDEFVIVELNKTHAGKPKDFILEQHWDRYKDFPITYAMLNVPDKLVHSWDIENWHRRMLRYELVDRKADWVILSDLDEIPRPEYIQFCPEVGRYVQDMYYFYLNAYMQKWVSGTVVVPYEYAMAKDFQEIRMDTSLNQVANAGWHFSSVGTEEDTIIKMKSYAHTEYGDEEGTRKVLDWRRNLQDIGGSSLTVVEIDNTYPKYIQETWESKWTHLVISPEKQ